MQKREAGTYFSFTRKERNGTIFLLIIISFLIAAPLVYPLFSKEKITDAGQFKSELAVLQLKEREGKKYKAKEADEEGYHQNNYQSSENRNVEQDLKREFFYFDPNTLSAAGWKKLGLRDKTIQTIQNYLGKGGKFRKPEDISKIWGIERSHAIQLENYVRIVGSSETVFLKNDVNEPKSERKKTFNLVDINSADSNALINLPGIGNKLSNRIISFRDKLGGFYDINQVAETFGLPDSVFQKIRPMIILDDSPVRKININTASLDELKQHPYIRYHLGNAIVQYRLQHGNYETVSAIRKIMLVNDQLYEKISPYLTSE